MLDDGQKTHASPKSGVTGGYLSSSNSCVLGCDPVSKSHTPQGFQARPESLTSCACLVFDLWPHLTQLRGQTIRAARPCPLTQDDEMHSLFRKQTLRLFAHGSQHDISRPALESTLASQMSRRRASCCTSLTRDVAPHVLNVHFVKPDFSGGVSDSDCAVFVVHDLRCSFLPRRHMHLSWRTQGHRAPGSLVTSLHEADVIQKCLHYTGSLTPPEHSRCCNIQAPQGEN